MQIQQVFRFISVFTITIALTGYLYVTTVQERFNGYLKQNIIMTNNETSKVPFDKWIVITTVSKPTEDIKKMADFKDWKIVIVADKKTPNNWSYDNCVFLSVEMQQSLGYKIVTLLPYKSYTRKMIGYLYAIENGAKFIYDTDDDNLPINLGLDSYDYSNRTSGLLRYHSQFDNLSNKDPQFFNVYSHFGRPDIWPRGFPLELINQNDETTSMLCQQLKTPVIQQGLVDKDADVDAIYRMIFVKDKLQGLNVNFDPIAPPVILDENVYCPFNSQNTLFHYDAFWALLLPTTVAFRVTDIWRGYWAQRLLHLTGNYLGFYGPNARQTRNPHDYFKDFIDEDQLYTDSARLVKIIQQWTCSNNDFSLCIVDLSMLMATHKLWGMDDYKLTKAWIDDLKFVGYQFPSKSDHVDQSKFDSCQFSGFVSNFKKMNEITTGKVQNLIKINELCDSVVLSKFQSSDFDEDLFNYTKDTVLVVVFNHPHFAHIPLLQMLYDIYFANVIFCGTFPQDLEKVKSSYTFFSGLWSKSKEFSYVNVTNNEMFNGYFHYMCLNKIVDMKITNVSGYLVIADDMLLNFWNSFDSENLVYTPFCYNVDANWPWWKGDYGEVRLNSLWTFLNETSPMNIDDGTLNTLKEILFNQIYCWSDIFYVPQRFGRKYQALSQLFFDHKVFLEIAVPRIMYLLGWANVYKFDQLFSVNDTQSFLTGTYWWTYRQGGDNAYPYYNESLHYLHTVKLSQLNKSNNHLDNFCNIYIKSMMNGINGIK